MKRVIKLSNVMPSLTCVLLAGLGQGCTGMPLATSSKFLGANNAVSTVNQPSPSPASPAGPSGEPVVSAPGAPIQTTSASSPASLASSSAASPESAPASSPVRQVGNVAPVAAPFAPGPVAATPPPKSRFHINPASNEKKDVPVGTPRQVQALWENRVITTNNVAANGQAMPCLAGRVYLMGEQVGHSFRANGTCIIDAYEILPGGKMKMIERWEFNNEMLTKLLFKDSIGWGYTLFLPWTTYRPDIQRVQLQAKFIPETGGLPLFSPASTISLTQQSQPSIHSTTIMPTAGRQ